MKRQIGWYVRSALGGLAIVVLSVGALYVALVSYHDRSPVDLGKVYEVAQADSEQQVVALLGKPDVVLRQEETASYTYSDPLSWYEFRVDFAADGTVLQCVFQD